MLNKNQKLISNLLGIILIMNLVVSLLPLWSGGYIADYYHDPSVYRTKLLDKVIYIEVVLFLILSLLLKNKVGHKYLFAVSIYAFFNAISVIVFGSGAGYFSLLAVWIIYVLLEKLKNQNLTSLRPFVMFYLFIWICLPFLEFLISDFSEKSLFFGSFTSRETTFMGFPIGFSGYDQHKNGYAYMIGFYLMLLYFCNLKNNIKIILACLPICLLFFSGTRSVMLALIVVFSYHKLKNNKLINRISGSKPIMFYIISCAIIIYVFAKLSLFEDEDRLYIITQFVQVISTNPLFGTGGYTIAQGLASEDLPAHNFILQGLADRGVIVFLCYAYMIWLYFRTSRSEGKVFLLYAMIIGLFQPDYNISIPSDFMMIAFLSPLLISNQNNIPIKK